jgi:PEP-CTERM motif-containing protein
MMGINLTSVMMAYENIGPGSIFLIPDQNVWDHVNDPSFDNDTMFQNLLQASTGAPAAVPEPASMVLVGSGLVAAARRLRRP